MNFKYEEVEKQHKAKIQKCVIHYFNEFISSGIRGENAGIPQCGEKFICVDQGGTLELHGRDKLSWTKLTKTVTKLSVGEGLYFKHQVGSRDIKISEFTCCMYISIKQLYRNIAEETTFHHRPK